jgi:hypothetical protein
LVAIYGVFGNYTRIWNPLLHEVIDVVPARASRCGHILVRASPDDDEDGPFGNKLSQHRSH